MLRGVCTKVEVVLDNQSFCSVIRFSILLVLNLAGRFPGISCSALPPAAGRTTIPQSLFEYIIAQGHSHAINQVAHNTLDTLPKGC